MKRDPLNIWLYAIWGAVAILLLLVVLTVQAGTIRGNEQSCIILARAAAWTTAVRDEGVSWAATKQRLKDAMDEVKGVPGSAIQDDEDYQMVLEMARILYHSPMTAEDAWNSTIQSCLHSKTEKRT